MASLGTCRLQCNLIACQLAGCLWLSPCHTDLPHMAQELCRCRSEAGQSHDQAFTACHPILSHADVQHICGRAKPELQ